MTGLADDKDAAAQAAARLTSRHDGLHFGGRRDDRRRISSWATLPMHTQSQRAGLPLCSILFRAFFFFPLSPDKEFRNNSEQLSRLRALDSKTASACIPFPDQNINQEGKGEHMGCL